MPKAICCPESSPIALWDTVVVQITTAGMDRRTDIFLGALDDVMRPACVILRNDTPARTLETLESYSARVAKAMASAADGASERRASLYVADPQAGQKSAGITTSATTAASWRRSRGASACSMPIATAEDLRCSRQSQGARAR
jgi:hypothetical protein